MKIIYTKSYDKSIKELKKRNEELILLEEIKRFIRKSKDFNYLLNNPLSKVYGLERLKYELNEYYSFRLSKTIRLIVKPKDNYIELIMLIINIIVGVLNMVGLKKIMLIQ